MSFLELTVSQLNRQIRLWLEQDIGEVQVIGEVSNVSKPSSGHLYFSLKDTEAQLRCVFFSNYHTITDNCIKNGQQVLAKGKLSLYEARGDYQLIVYSLRETGLGYFYQQFEALKKKLQDQGWFNADKKKPLPPFPSCIGIITSPNGAALHDILTTLARRYPLARVRLYPSEVQGKEAVFQLIQAVHRANEEKKVDVLIVARGGGSIEDLWAFNNESLALCIANSSIPVVTGIGHETDFTIADFVADLRAATPTAAAEAITPNQTELLALLKTLTQRARDSILRFTHYKNLLLSTQLSKILSPQQLIRSQWQSLDFLEHQLHQAMKASLKENSDKIYLLLRRLHAKHPQLLLQQRTIKINALFHQLVQLMKMRLDHLKQFFLRQLATLQAVSPLATLGRGYAIATLNKKILLNSSQAQKNDRIYLTLAHGSLYCTVTDKEE